MILLIKKTEIAQDNGINQIAISNSKNTQITITNNPKDHIRNLIKKGKLQEAADEFAEVYKLIGEIHPLHPLYTYKPIELGSKVVFEHHAINAEIAKQLPIKYNGRFSIIDKDMKEGETVNEFLSRKHFTQEKVQIDMKYIETWIGEQQIVDPLSLEQNAIHEGKWYILPAPLPPPIKAKMIIKGVEENVISDYLELRTKNISRMDSIGVISNEHQKNSPLIFTITIQKLSNNEFTTGNYDTNINLQVREGFERTVVAEIMFLTFMKYINNSGKLILFDLEKGVSFFEGEFPSLSSNNGVAEIDERLSILTDLRSIELYFGVNFNLPDNMTDEDFRKFEILNAIMNKKEIVSSLNNFHATFNETQGLENLIRNAENDSFMITANSSDQQDIEVFGTTIKNINMSYRIEDLKIKNLERIKKKIELFDEGEIIKVEFTPGRKNKLSTRYSVDLNAK